MGYTQDQLDALEQAIAEGAKKVKYQDKEVEYRSLAEMQAIRDMMRKDLGLVSNVPVKLQMNFKKGLYPDET
ncbi:MAG: hypothetical protein KAS07_04690 [Candidatus Pacebacteria bacterium]|nr:hypothetical protein [Candidatus Paceibacterota bacterium]